MSSLARCPASASASVWFRPKRAQTSLNFSARLAQIQTQTRSFGGTTRTDKAIPFSLQSSRASTAEGSNNVPEGIGASAGNSSSSSTSSGAVLRMLMFGKPGAGKGTLSQRLVKKYDILSLSTGDLLRQHIAEKTEVGRMAEEIVAQGGLLSDDIMLKVVSSRLDLLHNKHWILDGFPRTLGQGKLLHDHLRERDTPLSLVVNIDVADEIILNRISDRWVHLPSGRVYNLAYNAPKVPGLDDETGEPLTKRPDDTPETFARRLEKFYAATAPLLEYYNTSTTNPVITLTGTTSDEIWPQLENVLRSAFPTLKERPESREQKRRSSLSEAVLARQTADQTHVSTVGK